MRILCCGDRHWTNTKLIYDILEQYPPDTTIIHGCCRGADLISASVAKELDFEVIPFPADWDKYGHHKGSPAGVIRNQEMLDFGKPDCVLAFHDDIGHSVGTKDMVKRAEKSGVKVIIISENKPKKLPIVF